MRAVSLSLIALCRHCLKQPMSLVQSKLILLVTLLVAALWQSACAPHPTPAPAPAHLPATSTNPAVAPTPTLQSTATAQPANTAAPTIPPTSQPARPQPPRISVLAENIPGLDDLALAPDGSIYVSNVTDGTIKSYAPDRAPQTIVSGLSEPEGIVVLPDQTLIIVEQGKNRLLHYDLATQTLTPLLALENRTGQLGVDNIALDAHDPQHPTLIIPDSPNGRVLRASLDGQVLDVIAKGFMRPTGVAVEQDGSLLVVDENGNALKRIHPNGSIELLASLLTPDDVIVGDNGVIYVVTLGDSAIHRILPGSSRDEVFVGGLAGPQGIISDQSGHLIVTDTGHNRLLSITP